MSTEDVQTNLRMPARLKDRLQDAAKASGRTLTAEVIFRLEESFGQPSLRRAEADAETWDQLRSLRSQENTLAAALANLRRLRQELSDNAPVDAEGRITNEARSRLWQVDSDAYEIQTELRLVSKRMDEVYERVSGMAPGAGRSGK